MTVTTEQIQIAWQQLEAGAALDEVRRSWDRLVAIRRELDEAVVALAQRIEQLRIIAQQPPEPEPAPEEESAAGEEVGGVRYEFDDEDERESEVAS